MTKLTLDNREWLVNYDFVSDKLGEEYRHYTNEQLIHIQLNISEILTARYFNKVLK